MHNPKNFTHMENKFDNRNHNTADSGSDWNKDNTKNYGSCHSTCDKAAEIKDKIADNASQLRDKVADKASQIKHTVGEKVDQYKHTVKEKIADAADKVKDAMKD